MGCKPPDLRPLVFADAAASAHLQQWVTAYMQQALDSVHTAHHAARQAAEQVAERAAAALQQPETSTEQARSKTCFKKQRQKQRKQQVCSRCVLAC